MEIEKLPRSYVTNLPPDIQENDIEQEFTYYGAVDKVDIKQKTVKDSDGVQNTFAYVTTRFSDTSSVILKKKSKIFLKNGKIKIERNVSNEKAIHVIEKKNQKAAKKDLDENSKKADQKRLESLKKMKNSYNEQKMAIKNALAGVDTMKKSNKIVFGDEDDSRTQTQHNSQNKQSKLTASRDSSKKKPALFEDESDAEENYEGNFEIKQQFEGKRGEKLRRLQDRFQGDNLFKMDSKFLEEGGDDSDEDEVKPDNIETNENDERQWQLNILESVIGKKVHTNSRKEPKAAPSMLRFDPTRAEHTKFVEPKTKKRKAKPAAFEPETKRSKVEEEYEEVPEPAQNNEPPVSMEHFYEIRGDLKNSMGSGGFSLLSMFNRPADGAETTAPATEKPYEVKPIGTNNAKFLADFDPFKVESSDDEDDDGEKKMEVESKGENEGKKSAIKYESFFMLSSNDDRASEGFAFFKPSKNEDGTEANTKEYSDAQRLELQNIVKRKVKKSLKQALPRHAKPNKRFKRFAKNL